MGKMDLVKGVDVWLEEIRQEDSRKAMAKSVEVKSVLRRDVP